MTDDRGRMTEDRRQLVPSTAPLLWSSHHSTKLPSNLKALVEQVVMLCTIDVLASQRSSNPMLRFRLFAIRVRQLADKVGRITALLPGLGDVGPNGPRCTAKLVGERILLILWKSLCGLEDPLLKCKGGLIYPQIPK